jgi:hypothetical protein
MRVSGQHDAPAALYPPGKGPPVPVGQEAGWAPEPIWTQKLEEKSSAFVGYRTPVVQSVVRHYTDWATPSSLHFTITKINLFSLFKEIIPASTENRNKPKNKKCRVSDC